MKPHTFNTDPNEDTLHSTLRESQRPSLFENSGLTFTANFCGWFKTRLLVKAVLKLGLLTASICGCVYGEPIDLQRQNILLIVSDDQGLQLGSYGDRFARTPRTDELAAEGILYKNAYTTQASCSPARGSILTGLFPHENGQVGLSDVGFSVEEGIPFLPATLQSHGFYTGVIGKIHVAPAARVGFDFNGIKAQLTRHIRLVEEDFEKFLTQADDRNWFMMLNYSEPHRPHVNMIRRTGIANYTQVDGFPEEVQTGADVEPLDFIGVDSELIREDVAGYYNSVSRLDSGIGMILDSLKASGQYDNTTIIFTSDQGPGFTRSKTTCYEAGLRIPFIIKYPKSMDVSPSVSDDFVSLVDIAPTVTDVLEIKGGEFSGISLVPGGSPTPKRQYLFSEFTNHGGVQHFPRRSVRDERYKLIVNFEEDNPVKFIAGCALAEELSKEEYSGSFIKSVYERYIKPPQIELYDLKSDPWEFQNIADSNPREVRRLIQVLEQWGSATGDTVSYDEIGI